MGFDTRCKWHKSCGADLCHGEGVCSDFEKRNSPDKVKTIDIEKKVDLIKAFMQFEGNITLNSIGYNYDNRGGVRFSGDLGLL